MIYFLAAIGVLAILLAVSIGISALVIKIHDIWMVLHG